MHGVELRDRRTAAGLSLRQVARAAGTAETNVSSYERGTKTPSGRTLRRLLSAIEAGSSSPIYRMNLLTAPALSASLRKAIRDGWTTSDRLRLVREMRSNFRHVTTPADVAAFLAEPSTTGDARWDALVAGNVENLAIKNDLPVPEWSRGHALPFFWFVGEMPAMHAYDFAHSPLSMQARGVMVDPADLESV
jgi:transcriptional regulator with XRE-family HTH domain